ncbi:pentatricopeptide repeat-containing protein At5g39710-like [Pistacia vera]|uniref:pentatricopeptide repeat-containing protein At5g39710-like n=1 Tax=Pistacia vera TaxID=55513 RepID=UPI001263B3EE|nr:pentatricopeptide repeat-containing protein At5g39710-like [Pistacia vera]
MALFTMTDRENIRYANFLFRGDARIWWELMEDTHDVPVMTWGLCLENRSSEATRLYKKMAVFGVMPNVITEGKMEEAFRLLELMSQRGGEDGGSKWVVGIDKSRREGKMDEAYSLLELMSQKGLQPVVVTFNTMISGLCKEGKIKKANGLMELMSQRGLQPNVVMFTTMDVLVDEIAVVVKRLEDIS